MGHGKETPRQKMIGMMYLVLTALLALNVSKEVLDAFVLVDNGLQVTTEAFAAKNATSYSRFAFLNEDNAEKVGIWNERANELRTRTDELYEYIQQCKLDIIIDDNEYTLLVAPMKGFYKPGEGKENPGKTQMRVAYVETPERMKLVPELFARLFLEYEQKRELKQL